MDKYSLAAIGAITITAINIAALFNGIDGIVMTSCIAAIATIIAGTVGFRVGTGR